MNLFYINEQTNKLHDLVNELYESMFDEKEDRQSAIAKLKYHIEELENDHL